MRRNRTIENQFAYPGAGRLVGVGPLSLDSYGLLVLVAGRHSMLFIMTREDQKMTWLQKRTTGVAIVICVATCIGLEFLLKTLGYA